MQLNKSQDATLYEAQEMSTHLAICTANTPGCLYHRHTWSSALPTHLVICTANTPGCLYRQHTWLSVPPTHLVICTANTPGHLYRQHTWSSSFFRKRCNKFCHDDSCCLKARSKATLPSWDVEEYRIANGKTLKFYVEIAAWVMCSVLVPITLSQGINLEHSCSFSPVC
jgi:hypothetical protein